MALVARVLCMIAFTGFALSGPGALWAQSIDTQTTRTESGAESPLRSARTTSPRATLFSFLETLDEAYAAGVAGDAEASTQLVEQAIFHLDLSLVSDQRRRIWSAEVALKLKEVLDRVPLPPRDSVPGRSEATGQSRQTGILIGGASAAEAVPIQLWQIPGSSIQIHRVAEGPRAGEYLFTPSTVAQAADWYSSIRSAPYLRPQTPALYPAYAHSPGRSINPAFLKTTPLWLQRVWQEQTLWQWTGLAVVLVAALVAARYTLSFGRWIDARRAPESGPRWRYGSLLGRFLTMAYAMGAAAIVDDVLNLTGEVLWRVDFALSLIAWVLFGSVVFLACQQVFELAVHLRKLRPAGAPAQLIRLVGFFVGAALLAGVFIAAAEDFGLPGYSIVTGLGVGGIAVSLAAKETLSDLFGSFVIMTERPYRIGDFINVGGETGTVEAIGFRSTRLRTAGDLVVFIPNASISNSRVTNYGFRHKFLIDTTVRIDEKTPREKIETFLEQARTAVSEIPSVVDGSAQIRLHDFKLGHLEILVHLSIGAENWGGSLNERESVMLAIMQVAEETGVQLAPPQMSDLS